MKIELRFNQNFLSISASSASEWSVSKNFAPELTAHQLEVPAAVFRYLGEATLTPRPIGAVIGCRASSPRFSPAVQAQAKAFGKLLAEHGFITLTGGLSGVMEVAAQGAKAARGLTLGILPGSEKAAANASLDIVLPSGIGIARNYLIAQAADVLIAVNGGRGTLEEMSYGLDFEKPVYSLGSWDCLPEVVQLAREEEIVVPLKELLARALHAQLLKEHHA